MITNEQIMTIKPGDKLFRIGNPSLNENPFLIVGTVTDIAHGEPEKIEGQVSFYNNEIINYSLTATVTFVMKALSISPVDAWKHFLEGCRSNYRSRQKVQIELERLMNYASAQIPEKRFSTFQKQCSERGCDPDMTSPMQLACVLVSKDPEKISMYDLGKVVFGDITMHQMEKDHGIAWPSKAIWQIIKNG